MNLTQQELPHFIEGIRAQRTEALDESASWFAKYCAEVERGQAKDTRIKELEDKYEPKPKEDAATPQA